MALVRPGVHAAQTVAASNPVRLDLGQTFAQLPLARKCTSTGPVAQRRRAAVFRITGNDLATACTRSVGACRSALE